MVKLKHIIIIFLFVAIFVIYNDKVYGAYMLSGIENFPSSYRPYLKELTKRHTNWDFIALYTELDWDDVITEENKFGKNLVPINYSDEWKNNKEGEYNIELDNGWVDSSKRAVEYLMDPRNFLNEKRIFQFEELYYSANTNNLNCIEKILYGTEFYQKSVSYYDSHKNLINTNDKYSELILKAGKTSNVSPYHLASRIKQEVGPFLSHSSISGLVEGYEGLYNFYNIGATNSNEPLGAIKNGLQYAKNGKNANLELRNQYLIPWNTKEKAITGGAIFIGSSYINKGQNTIYLQKFHVNDLNSNILFWHQYMSNILAPYSESKSIYNGYAKAGILDTSMLFIIPVYKNMPEIQTENPNIDMKEYIVDESKVICNSNDISVKTGPNTSYETITTINENEELIRIRKSIREGERWDKVRLSNGIEGYVFENYLKQKESQEENEEIIYGDVNGDKKINSVDLLLIQRHILEKQKLTGKFLKAANVRKTGEEPTSIDLLLIQRHILGLYTIN